ncbi:MAG TPA: hypothetical protein VG267_16075 [Terracidiphilus sp.]|jgi:hypothetical protein|nr:hypothetical protein [Terracidiphilus sp.]
MKSTRWTAIALLAFLAMSGFAGSLPMIAHADGNPLGMAQSLLQYSPFHSFLIPGILLLASSGVLTVWVLWQAAWERRDYGWWTAFQGSVLLVWLVTECFMLRLVIWAHYLYGAVAVGLILAGLALRREPNLCGQEDGKRSPRG